jgi:hypothetical protein
LALGLRRPRKRRHHSVNSILYWLCYWPMGRRRQIFMESLWNSIEGWHSKLKKMTQHAHPNIHSLSRVVVPATLHNISVNAHFTKFL